MRKKYIIVTAGLLILLSSFGAWALYLFNKPHRNAGNLPPEFRMKAGDLYREYSRDEAAANRKFVDKVVEVMGTVSGREQTDSTMSILLNTGDPAAAINCSFLLTGDKKISPPSTGSPVTIKGKCAGFLNDVNLVDCVLE